MTATTLHRGLISGYPAERRAFVREKRLTRRSLLADIAAVFAPLFIAGSWIPRRKSWQFT